MKRILSLVMITTITLLYGCNDNQVKEITNPSFETGTLKGWEIKGEAFSNSGVIFDDKDSLGNYYNQEGDFFFYGGNAKKGSVGELLSNEFVLSGNGLIGFKIGAGKNYEKCYVALIDSKGNELVTRGNYEFDVNDSADTLHRVILDASSHIGKKVRIKVVDNDSGVDGYNYINIDDFIVNYQGVVEPVGKVAKAHQYVLDNMYKVNPRYRQTYHAMPPLNWGNDPNGLIYYQGKGHLFFQFNPYEPVWGPMHWGHYTTDDFIKWELQPIALAPDQDYGYQFGAFSGTAIEKDGKLYLMYTGVANNLQQQALAVSSDGITFEKLNRNPVISINQLPKGASPQDFRDPKVFYKNGSYYAIIGSRMNGYGMILMYKSHNLTSWEYVGQVMNNSNPNEPNFYQLNGVYECPDFFEIDGKEVIIASPQFLPKDGNKFENIHSVVYMIGEFNYETGRFTYDEFIEFDSGFDFYAAQTLKHEDGRTILIAWKQMWDRTLVTQSDNWVGSYTLPRELTYKNNRIYQAPVREIKNYRKNHVSYTNQIIDGSLRLDRVMGTTVELEFELEMNNASKAGVKLFKGAVNETVLSYDKATQTLTFGRSRSGKSISGAESNDFYRAETIPLIDGKIKLRIFLDISSVEVFINDGYMTMTSNVYPDEFDVGIEFFSENGQARIISLDKYDIIV